ncbi:hypothetical protein [Microvirga solisilvae]|uniref:hypothetical protein n=1 Tax=Microvirga solisilvae TaxID=2919498 RepID=UPI0024344EF3|nr:hypothetical protein [Microvirga solisilvae]
MSMPTGTDGDDIFAVDSTSLEGGIFDGGAGNDTLQLLGGGLFDLDLPLVWNGIEKVLGSDQNDTILIAAERLAGLAIIDGGADPALTWDVLQLKGGILDLRGLTITNIDRIEVCTDDAVLTLGNKSLALLASGYAARNDQLVLVGDTFTAAQIKMLHQRGIDTITDANGVHRNEAPTVAGLDGDRVSIAAGQTVFVDVGSNAEIVDDGRLGVLNIMVANGFQDDDWLGIDTAGVISLSDGVEVGSVVSVHGVEVGTIWGAGGPKIDIAFNANATPSVVREIIRAITYSASAVAPSSSTTREIVFEMSDDGGRSVRSVARINQIVNEAPNALSLSETAVKEASSSGTVVGFLEAADPNPGDVLSFTLIDNADGRFALVGNKLVIADGTKLDFERDQTHSVLVRVTDEDGLSFDQSFTITVQDVPGDTVTAPTDSDDVIVVGTGSTSVFGGRGNDKLIGNSRGNKLSGGWGNDVLYGKGGNDVLTGGADKDIFVFDTKPNKKTNVDRITDYSVKSDSIYLENAIFTKLGKSGTFKKPALLQKKMFWIGKAAHDADDRVIYNPKDGSLYYDADGSGRVAAVKIAVLQKSLKAMSYKELYIV